MLQAGRRRVRFPFNASSRPIALGLTLPLTEMDVRILPGGGRGKTRPARKTDNLTTICELIV
jgi:hypothetical protein